MKISLKDLKKAISWIETYSTDILLTIKPDLTENRYLTIQAKDKYGVDVTITIYNDSSRLPRITKEEQLP